MTVLIAHADADREAAEALERYLERRGVFVERETASAGFRSVQGGDLIVSLWSKDAISAPDRIALENRALEGWAEGRLMLVKLDLAFAPVGLRDLATIDACIAGQRDIAWAAIAKRALDKPAPKASETAQRPARAPIVSSGVAAASALASAALALMAGGLWPAPIGPEALLGGAIGAGLCAIGSGAFAAGRALAQRPRTESQAAPPQGGAVVLCAPGDRASVDPLLSGPGRIADSIEAVRGADKVVVILTARAFENDFVKRGLFLAARIGVTIRPIFSDGPGAPADFLAFLDGADAIDWSTAPESERARTLRRTIAA